MDEMQFNSQSVKLVPTDRLKIMVYDMSSDMQELRRRIDLCNEEIAKRFLEESKQKQPATGEEKGS